MSWRTRTDSTTSIRRTDDDLTDPLNQRRRNTLESQTHTHSKAAERQRNQKLRELQSGERASTIPTTQNTCSSPGNPVTTDLSHFPAL